ncbi:cyclophilin-like domain-containing protein [Crepidotus variabilis]|uniref:Cyclophilin-like domain-containing protein n=1 Tax=Crepidotus variabilis TaxID=179855 RepID=A0A9P6E765_9AGAR|nr:cyclophilin-like domain-containing protein [Crepidotus variabilis]
MGHGNSNKLYITHAEHAGLHGAHSSSTGFRAKAEAPHPGARTPLDCCALSFQPFAHPVCAREPDGTGYVFDLVNIIPWLKQHNNTHPITKEPLSPSDLISLHYSRKEATNEIHDPISFKPFNEHSHIVAIATTGNVFLAESIKGGKDLVADVPFKKTDVITLQNPHGLPSASVSAVAKTAPKDAIPKPAQAAAVTALKEKEVIPWNVSPYSSGMAGASLTSTSVDRAEVGSSKLLWDEEELMFEDISKPLKGKGKEKDIGKRRAYVRIITSLGGASLNLELYCEKAPKTCYNFLQLARQGKYNDCLFHRLVPGFMIQTGDPTGTGTGGESYWGTPFRDENELKGAAKHDGRGVLAMANKGKDTNGSQFYLTFKPAPHLDKKHTVFGTLVGGEDVLDALEKIPVKTGTDRPAKIVKMTEVIIYQDPFEDYKKRLVKKHARQAENEKNGGVGLTPAAKPKDDVNWFGTKVGSQNAVSEVASAGSGVGKYLSLKRPQAAISGSVSDLRVGLNDEDAKKKRKIGFGNFDAW